MKKLKVIAMLPLAIFCLLSLMVIDLARTVQGKPTVDEEWRKIYMNDNMNHRK